MKPSIKHETIPDREYLYSARPDDRYRPFKRKQRVAEPQWVAPEHGKFARHMERAYDLDHNGNKIVEMGKRLVLERRPEIMVPKRTPIFLGLDQPSA